MKIEKLIPVDEPLVEIEEIVNDENNIVFQVYYQQYNSDGTILENDFDRKPQIKFTKELSKNHFESFDTLEEAIKMVNKYGYKVSKIISNTYLPFVDQINDMIDKDYEGFVKSLVSIEKNITDPDKLNDIYNIFKKNDDIQILNLNDLFEDFDLEL